MKIIYILSVIYLMFMFLIYKKSNKSLCFISSIVYTIALLLCYNTFIVYLLYLLGIKGSFLIFSIINYFIGTIISIIIYIKGKKIQKYSFDKKKCIIFLILTLIIFLIGYFRFRGFQVISFESGDAAVHYRHALEFSEDLSILDRSNSQDEIFGAFVRVMPISYINCGLIFNIFSGVNPYIVFMWYNIISLIISGLLFLVTAIDVFNYKKKDYIYALVFSLFYTLAFPLNIFLMGFCYLTLSIVVINLLYLTIFHFKNDFDKKIWFKIIIIFLITFSCFYSYYLFVPALYLALGIYYIYLWKQKKINFKQMGLYGVLTLIVPFIIGFIYFFISLFLDKGIGIVSDTMNTWGYCYDNITPVYLFIIVTAYLTYDFFKNKRFKKKKFDYLSISLYIVSLYSIIFLALHIYNLIEPYYFYKLFSLYWLLLVLFFGKKIASYRKVFYVFLLILSIANIFVFLFPGNKLATFLTKTNIYTFNTGTFNDDKLVFDKKELEILEKSIEYKEICEKDGRYLVSGNALQPIWSYSITDIIPVSGEVNGEVSILYDGTIPNFSAWKYFIDKGCLVYYYNGRATNIDRDRYKVLYENEAGIIIRRNDG